VLWQLFQRDGAALNGLKTGSPGSHRYPLLLKLGKNVLFDTWYFRKHAALLT
jgi:hypothetical protein